MVKGMGLGFGAAGSEILVSMALDSRLWFRISEADARLLSDVKKTPSLENPKPLNLRP